MLHIELYRAPLGTAPLGQGSVGQGSVGQGSIGQGSIGQGSSKGAHILWDRRRTTFVNSGQRSDPASWIAFLEPGGTNVLE